MESLSKSLEVSKLIKEIGVLVRQRVGREMQDIGLPGITMSQGMVVGLLHKNGQMKVSELSRKLGMNNSTTSEMIGRLEKQGLVERLRSEEDKRVVYIRLSPGFCRMDADMKTKMEGIVEKIVSNGATEEDYNKMIEGLSILKRLLLEKDGR